jgi:hypothetical protein
MALVAFGPLIKSLIMWCAGQSGADRKDGASLAYSIGLGRAEQSLKKIHYALVQFCSDNQIDINGNLNAVQRWTQTPQLSKGQK